MTTRAYQIDDDLTLNPLAAESLAEVCRRDRSTVVWLDLQTPDSGELERYLDVFQFHGLSRRIVLEASERRGLYPLKNELVLIVPTTRVITTPAGAVEHIVCICRDNLLISIHASPLWQNQENIDDSRNWLPTRSPAALLAVAMFELSQSSLRRTAELRRTILAIEDRMERAPESVSAEELVELRPDLAALSAVVADQLPALQALTAIDKPYFKLGEAQDLLQCAVASLRACERTAHGLEQRLVGLRAAFQMHAQDKANSRLNMLTVLSSIFMPLTLLAGIWGMNFKHMPELELSSGYPLALSSMLLVAGAMYALFRRAGWFG